jgi:hypothetical protein
MVWFGEQRIAVGLSVAGDRLYALDINDVRWLETMLPEGVQGIDLRGESAGLSLLTHDGEVARIRDLSSGWTWRTGLVAARGHSWSMHLPMPSGAVLFGDGEGIFRIDRDGILEFIGFAPSSRSLVFTGDGGLMALGPRVTTCFYSE